MRLTLRRLTAPSVAKGGQGKRCGSGESRGNHPLEEGDCLSFIHVEARLTDMKLYLFSSSSPAYAHRFLQSFLLRLPSPSISAYLLCLDSQNRFRRCVPFQPQIHWPGQRQIIEIIRTASQARAWSRWPQAFSGFIRFVGCA